MGYIRNGVKHWQTEWRNNLILDVGLDKMANVYEGDCWNTCLYSNQVSPTNVRRDSGAITFTQSGTTLTASSNFFVPSDTGRLFKYGTGSGGAEVYLTYISATVCTASISMTVASATAGTIWYVNDTALNSLYASTTNYDTSGGACSSSSAGNTVTKQRTWIGAAVGAPVTLTEVGFNNNGSNSNIFDRDIVPSGVSLSAGDRPLIVAQVISTYNPTTPLAVGNVGSGCNTSGNMQIVGLNVTGGNSYVSYINNTGGANTANAILEPAYDPSGSSPPPIAIINQAPTVPAFGATNTGYNIGHATATSSGLRSYAAGSFFRNKFCSFDNTVANGTIYGVGMVDLNTNTIPLIQSFTTPFTKSSLQRFDYELRVSWQRILTN